MVMAGLPRVSRERVRGFWRARLAGLSVGEAAASVGASETAGFAWIAESGGMIPVDLQIDRRCGSGLQSVLYACMQVMTGGSDLVLAGGAESMSQVEFYVPDARWNQGGLPHLKDRL